MDVIYDMQITGGSEKGGEIAVKSGTLLTVKTIISNPMERAHSGKAGEASKITPSRIDKLTARFNDMEFFHSDFRDGVSANPYLTFCLRPDKSGSLIVAWIDNKGKNWTLERKIKVD